MQRRLPNWCASASGLQFVQCLLDRPLRFPSTAAIMQFRIHISPRNKRCASRKCGRLMKFRRKSQPREGLAAKQPSLGRQKRNERRNLISRRSLCHAAIPHLNRPLTDQSPTSLSLAPGLWLSPLFWGVWGGGKNFKDGHLLDQSDLTKSSLRFALRYGSGESQLGLLFRHRAESTFCGR